MKRFVEGVGRSQGTLFPEHLEDWIGEDNPVRVIDVFVDALDRRSRRLRCYVGLPRTNGRYPHRVTKMNALNQPLKVINLGLQSFAIELEESDVEVLHVDWRPPSGGDARLLALLASLEDKA